MLEIGRSVLEANRKLLGLYGYFKNRGRFDVTGKRGQFDVAKDGIQRLVPFVYFPVLVHERFSFLLHHDCV